MKRLTAALLTLLFLLSFGLTVMGSELPAFHKIDSLDDFFADYSLIPPPEPVYLPIIMYHQISKKPSKLGTYVISADEFENDLKLFKEQGFTTITVDDLLKFTAKEGKLPEKPIMLTFDDGYESDYAYALPLLQKYHMEAIFSVVGKFVDEYSQPNMVRNIDYAMLSWDEIKEMYDSGAADFQNHSYDMHNQEKRYGAMPHKFENDKEYQNAIEKDLGRLNAKYKEYTGKVPEAFTCPFGGYNDRVKEAVRKAGFSAIFTSYQKMNTLTGDPEELFFLKRFLRTHDKDMQALVKSWNEEYYQKK